MDYLARTPGIGSGSDGGPGYQQLRSRKTLISPAVYSDTDVRTVYPYGYNPLCPTCSFLSESYGPDDGELYIHCQYYGNDPTGIADNCHYDVGDPDNPNLNQSHAAS